MIAAAIDAYVRIAQGKELLIVNAVARSPMYEEDTVIASRISVPAF